MAGLGQKITEGIDSAINRLEGAINDISAANWGTDNTLNKTPYNNDNYKLKIYIGGDFKNPITGYLPEQVSFSSVSKWSPFLQDLMNNIPIVGNVLGGAQKTIDTSISAFGYQVNSKWARLNSWHGNEPPTFSFDLQFNAYSSPLNEVILPILQLLSLTMPTTKPGSALVEAPGPDIAKMFLSQATEGINNLATSGQVQKLGGLASAEVGATMQSAVMTAASKLKSINTSYQNSSFKKDHDKSIILQIGNYMRLTDVVLQSIHPKFDSMFYGKSGLPISAEASCTFQMLYPPTVQDLASWFIGTDSNRPMRSEQSANSIRSAVGL